MEFRIEGWFPPITYTSHVDGLKYAICGSNWIVIPHEMTLEEVTKGWVCTAKDTKKVDTKPLYPKRLSKKQIAEQYKTIEING
jgi:hypothetical protein